MNLIEVKNLSTSFTTENGYVKVLDDISFSIKRGQSVGIVGESGCGKSVTSLSIMRLLPKPAGNIETGEILFNGEDLLKLDISQMYKIRGKKISMIFQEPMTALNPVQKIGKQMAEVYQLHYPEMGQEDIINASLDMLISVGVSDPVARLSQFPHELSGGIRQRVMIAMALACGPDLLIADEPTTALDVSIQAQILALLKKIQKERNLSIMFITHDLGVIAQLCDQVVVMYAGKIAEIADVHTLFKNPKHPYTQGLLNSIPRLETQRKSVLSTIEGMVPDLSSLPPGCRFANRCPYKMDECILTQPPMKDFGNNHKASCIL